MQYQLIEYGILIIICTYLVLRYSAPSVTWHVKFWSILTWVLNFGLALLVPQDTYYSLLYPNTPTPQKQTIQYQYLILYWSVYILTWTIIPVLQQWQNSADLKSIDRLKRSLKVNGIFYLYMLIGGIAVLIPLIVFDVGGDMGLVTYLKCLATCWGIFLQMGMMGYAIVEIPRSFWLSAHPQKHKYYCYKKIPETQQQLTQAIFQFKQICSYILHTKQQKPQQLDIQQYANISMSLIPQQLKLQIPKKYNDYLSHLDYMQSYPIGLQSIIEHYRLMKRVIARIRRLRIEEEEFIRESILDEEVAYAQKNGTQLKSDVISVTPMVSLWKVKIKPLLYKVAAIFLTIFGTLITIAQTQVFLTNQSSLLVWLLPLSNPNATRILVFLIIALISYMVYYSLFRIKLSNIYGMYKGGSDGPSIMFATINFSRVGVAIVLNFFDMVKINSVYKDAMGTVNMGLLGEWVIKGIPGVLWIIIMCHYWDAWGYLIRKFRLSDDLKFNVHKIDQEDLPPVPYQVTRRKEQLRRKNNTLGNFGIPKQINLQQRFI